MHLFICVYPRFISVWKLHKCLLEKSQGADRALLYSDFGFLGVNRKKARGKEDRGGEKDATSGWTRGKRKEERYLDGAQRRGKKEKGGTLLSRSIALLPLFSPYIQPHCIGAWGCGVSICPPSDPLRAACTRSPQSPRPLEAAFCPIMRAKYCRHGTTSTVVATKRERGEKKQGDVTRPTDAAW